MDFDNIYIRLEHQYNNDVARNFACNPEKWAAWIERNATSTCENGRPGCRKLLVRRCYMNPEKFSGFRRKFTQAAFEVIDCPPLTDQGKTSTDIHIVMDVLDTLAHPVHLDEFVILSGDADFTPLLLRLRRHDRFTTILSAGHASAAYKASCDSIIPIDDFIFQALGLSSEALTKAAPQNGVQVSPAVVSVEQPDLPPNGKKANQREVSDKQQPKKSGPVRMEDLISKIHTATELPNLSHKQYSALFKALANEINTNGYKLDETSRAVQMHCAEKNITVMEGHVDAVIEGCHREHYYFRMGKESAEAVAHGYLKYIKELCRMKNLKLNKDELKLLDLWITGKAIKQPIEALSN